MPLSLFRTAFAPSTASPNKIMKLKWTIRLMNHGGVNDTSFPSRSAGASSCGSATRCKTAPIPRFALSYARLIADGGSEAGAQAVGKDASILPLVAGGWGGADLGTTTGVSVNTKSPPVVRGTL